MAQEADRVIDIYRRHAAAWDRDRGRGLFEKRWLDRFAALLPPGGRVLDLACGAGEPIARDLLGRGFAVTGVDSAPEMIALCRARLAGDWVTADMRRLDLGRRFDGIVAWDSLFHFTPEDQRQMFPIFAAHAAPRAALLFTSGTSHGSVVGELYGEPLYHASLDPAEYRELVARHGFRVVAHVVEDPDCGGHTVWLAARG